MSRAPASRVSAIPKELGMDQVDRADVEGCRNADLAAKRDHPFGEIEARAPVIEAAVDMSRLDVEEGGERRPPRRSADKEPHGEAPRPAHARRQKFAIERGEVGGHSGRGYGGRAGRSTCAGGRRRVLRFEWAGDRSVWMSLVAIGARLRAICLSLPEAHEVVDAARTVIPRRGARSSLSNAPGATGSRSGARVPGRLA